MRTAKDLTLVEKLTIECSTLCALISLLYDDDNLPNDLRVAIIDLMCSLEELRIDSMIYCKEKENEDLC